MRKTILSIMLVALCCATSCNKVASKGAKVAEKEVMEKMAKTAVSTTLRSRLETVAGKQLSTRLIKLLENNPELARLLEKNPSFINTWVYLEKSLPKSSLNTKFVTSLLNAEKYSKGGRFGGNKIENYILEETTDGRILVKSRSKVKELLGEIDIFIDPPTVKVYTVGPNGPLRNMFANLHPMPNAKYIVDKAQYFTDDAGRVVKTTFSIDKTHVTAPNLYNPKDITAIGKLKGGLAGDDGGHLLGNNFGGSSSVLNIVPMKSSVNRTGEFRELERLWEAAAKEGKTINTEIKLKYPAGTSERPEWIEVIYHVDGKKYTKLISNQA